MTPAFSVIVPIAPDRRPLLPASLHGAEVAGGFELVTQVGRNPSRNRNMAIARAQGAVLAFTDDDCVVPPDWLARAAAFFATHPEYDAVGGPQLDLAAPTPVERAAGYALGSRFGTGRLSRRFRIARLRMTATERDLTAANLFVTRAAFARCGPFDERLWPNEETMLLRRLQRAGARIAYDPSIVVFHKRRGSVRALGAQCFGYGRGRARQSRLERRWVPPLEVTIASGFLAYLATLPVLLAGAAAASVPLLVYVACSLAVATATAVRRRDPAAGLRMPLALLTVHLAYPAGFAAEMLRTSIEPAAARLPDGASVEPVVTP